MCWMNDRQPGRARALDPLAPGRIQYWYRESPPCCNYGKMDNMTDPRDYLKLVDSPANSLGDDAEFLPLPYYPWERRPSYLPLDVEEVATALYLTAGLIGQAAERLKTEPLKVVRAISRSARLTRLHQELAALLNDKVHEEYVKAFSSEDDRRREWASSKVSQTKGFQVHPLAPNTNVSQGLPVGSSGPTRIIISWEDPSPLTIDHRPADE